MNLNALVRSTRNRIAWILTTLIIPCILAVIPLVGSYYDAMWASIVLLLLILTGASGVSFVVVVFGGRKSRRRLQARPDRRDIRADTLIMAVSKPGDLGELRKIRSLEDMQQNLAWLGLPLRVLVEHCGLIRRVGFLVSTESQQTAQVYAKLLGFRGVSVEPVYLDQGKSGDLDHLNRKVGELLETLDAVKRADDVLVDVTGGTKLMSIALYERAIDAGLSVSYVASDHSGGAPDPETSRIMWLREGQLIPDPRSEG